MAGGGACAVVVRRACAADAAARAALLSDVYAEYNTDAFLLFFFQEATLEGMVLCGAVLFIFCGASPFACALLVPAAAALIALGVRLAHAQLAHRHAQRMVKEWYGWVAEARAPGAGPPPGAAVRVSARRDAQGDDDATIVQFTQVVGTVSICGHGSGEAARLVGLAVARGWRRRGVGSALAAAAREEACARGVPALHAVVSQLQGTARAVLQDRGWRCRGAGHLPLANGLLALQVAHLVADLPHA